MDSYERALAERNGGPHPMTAGQMRRARKEATMASTTTKKAPAKAAKAAADKARAKRTTNKGQTCSVRGCSFPAKRRGLCSGPNSNRHYRAALKAERDKAAKK